MATYKELLAQRAELEKQIEETRSLELADAIARTKELIAEYGLTATDCGFRLGGAAAAMAAAKPRSTVPVKYRGPNGETWSGRGKAPNWLTSLETHQDRDRDEFLVNRL
jgi:DNA-binding protein H-NS